MAKLLRLSLSILLLDSIVAFVHYIGNSQARRRDNSRIGLQQKISIQDDHSISIGNGQHSRRHTIKFFGAAAISPLYYPMVSAAQDETVFLDLPSLPDDAVRIFLCRHGQTENNRLKKVQGARLDPDINETGKEQARRLGIALALGSGSTVPSHIYHSPLKRARQTAQVAASQFRKNIPTSQLDAVREIDFGPAAEGAAVSLYRAQMKATYANWSIGNLDAYMSEGGETGRDVLIRAEEALATLRDAALKTPSRCVAVVSHSAFLKVLLATAAPDTSLASVSALAQMNCALNVLDLDGHRSRNVSARDALVGGRLSRARDFKLQVPQGDVVRINETRHLRELAV